MSLAFYINTFRELNVNRARGHASPHKACMLLAVMDLIEKGVITRNEIQFGDALADKFRHHTEILGSEA